MFSYLYDFLTSVDRKILSWQKKFEKLICVSNSFKTNYCESIIKTFLDLKTLNLKLRKYNFVYI